MNEKNLTHFDASGSAVMVDVSEKPVTARQAVARGIITMNAAAFAAVRDGTAQKVYGSTGTSLYSADSAGQLESQQGNFFLV